MTNKTREEILKDWEVSKDIKRLINKECYVFRKKPFVNKLGIDLKKDEYWFAKHFGLLMFQEGKEIMLKEAIEIVDKVKKLWEKPLINEPCTNAERGMVINVLTDIESKLKKLGEKHG